jgi:hypothetical protein
MIRDPVVGSVHKDWGFKDENTTEFTHGIHPYPARLVPQVARKVLTLFGNGTPSVWDPFCGSGTVLLEAMTKGLPALGTDINPFACLLARAKTTPITPRELNRITEMLVVRLRGEAANQARRAYRPRLDDFTLDVERWWKPSVIRDLGFIREQIEEVESISGIEPAFDLLDVVFSHTVRVVSNQRRNEFKRYRRPEDELASFKPDVVGEFLSRWHSVSRMVANFSDRFNKAPRPHVEVADCSTFSPRGPVDLIITSPPYGDSTTTVAYGQYSSLMMEWLPRLSSDWRSIDRGSVGGDPTNLRGRSQSPTLERVLEQIHRIDPHRASVVRAFFGDMRACLSNFLGNLSRGGHVCIVIGDRTVREVTVPNATILTEDAVDIGFRHVETVSRRIYFKVGPYRVNPIGRTGRDQDTPAIGKEEIIILAANR